MFFEVSKGIASESLHKKFQWFPSSDFILRRLWRLQPKQCQQPRLPSPCPLARKSPLCLSCVSVDFAEATLGSEALHCRGWRVRINYRFFALLNKISLCISPKKNDDDMKEWVKWAKDGISSNEILSHGERVVGQWKFANRWTVGAKRISNDLEWYSYMTYYFPLIFGGISNMFIFNLTCGDDPIWPHISTGLNHHQVH